MIISRVGNCKSLIQFKSCSWGEKRSCNTASKMTALRFILVLSSEHRSIDHLNSPFAAYFSKRHMGLWIGSPFSIMRTLLNINLSLWAIIGYRLPRDLLRVNGRAIDWTGTSLLWSIPGFHSADSTMLLDSSPSIADFIYSTSSLVRERYIFTSEEYPPSRKHHNNDMRNNLTD